MKLHGRPLAGLTLRTRLIAGLLALFTLASLAVGLATTLALRGYLVGQLDRQLPTAIAMSVSIEHLPGPGKGPGGGPSSPCRRANQNPAVAAGQQPGTLAARLARGRLAFACIVTGPGGLSSARLSAADLALLRRLPLGAPSTGDLSRLGPYRFTTFRGPDGDIHIAGLPLSGVQATVRQLELIEVVVFGAALLAMGLAGVGLIRLSLRPLGRITATAAEVSALPLGRGEVTLPQRVPVADPRTEVGRLAHALNQMLGHVEASLAQRQAAEARLRQFIADASHELRTPLAGIRGYTELALRVGGDLGPEVRGALSRVDAESARMRRLVDDLLLLARLDAGRPLDRASVDVSRLAIDVTNDARVAGPDHRWVLDLPAEPILISGDEHRLHQVLANLLSNARSHTPGGTTVTVRLAGAPGGVELAVSDDGPGIPAGLRDQVWERFSRGDSARSRKAGGTGLGLAIVRAVVAAHHGEVSLASQPGSTTFRIWLPANAVTEPDQPA
jgi:two-component system OmpR family sensor kinase